jgi:hypothetical protein
VASRPILASTARLSSSAPRNLTPLVTWALNKPSVATPVFLRPEDFGAAIQAIQAWKHICCEEPP